MARGMSSESGWTTGRRAIGLLAVIVLFLSASPMAQAQVVDPEASSDPVTASATATAAEQPGAPGRLSATATALAIGREWLELWRTSPEARGQAALVASWVGVGGFGLMGVLGAMRLAWRSRRRRVAPRDFVERLNERMQAGKLDRGKLLDLCEIHPSPVSRVVLAAAQRWGRSASDLDRAAASACRMERYRLARGLSGLRRLGALALISGLVGALGTGDPLGSTTLAGLVAAAVLYVLHDATRARLEDLEVVLERISGEAVDAILKASTAPTTVTAGVTKPIAAATVLKDREPIRGRPVSEHAEPPGPANSGILRGTHSPIRVDMSPEVIGRGYIPEDDYDEYVR